ncbi:MAG: rod shape-determining protein MreC [Planctomycetaceae bacterium]|nr:rod shape-determining protein MreC [Planctomycetaceae bacterium]
MTMFSWLAQGIRGCTAGRQCLLLCALGVVASFFPPRWLEPARGAVERVLAPGQEALAPPLAAVAEFLARAARLWQQAGELTRLETRLHELETANQLLQQQLAAAAPTAPATDPLPASAELPPLLEGTLVPARPLGRQARSYLARRDLLDVGAPLGAARDALVVDLGAPSIPLIDAGRDRGLAPHERVVANIGNAHLVWGKIVDVGPLTSTLRRASDAGFRDLAQLAHVTRDGLRWGARGVLEGDGSRWCQLTRVDLAAPVDVGDLVFAADQAGLASVAPDGAPSRFLYGSVVRIERPAAEPHWRIWIEPAIPRDAEPARVAVVTTRLNPARIAAGAGDVESPQPSPARRR